MKSTVENLSPTRVRLAVEVPFDELRPSLDKAYRSIAKQVRVPGFRPGKAPARIIEARVGRSVVLDEAVQDAIPRAYADAVRDNAVRAIGQPEIELTSLDDGTSLAFTAEVDVRPEVAVPDLAALSVTVDDAVVADGDIDEQLVGLQDRFAVLRAADRPARAGDYVSIDLAARVEGEEVPDGSATGLSYEIGSGDLLTGLDDALVGTSAGEQRTFQTELASGSLAGRTADVTVTVRSVKEKELPALDDDFAQTASEFDTLAELRADLRSRLERVRALEQGSQARDRVMAALLAATDVPLPESAVRSEVDWRQQDVTHQLEHAGTTLEAYLAAESRSLEEFQREIRDSSETAVKTQLVLDAIAEQQQVGVSDADLATQVLSQAQRYGVSPQEFANQIAQAGSLPTLVADVRRNKALAHVLDQATVTDATGRPVDLAALRAAPADEDDEADGELLGADGGELAGGELASSEAAGAADPADVAGSDPAVADTTAGASRAAEPGVTAATARAGSGV